MMFLTLMRYGSEWGFEYKPKFSAFKGALFACDQDARNWLRLEHGGREVRPDVFVLCGCRTCDYCVGNPLTAADKAIDRSYRRFIPHYMKGVGHG